MQTGVKITNVECSMTLSKPIECNMGVDESVIHQRQRVTVCILAS